MVYGCFDLEARKEVKEESGDRLQDGETIWTCSSSCMDEFEWVLLAPDREGWAALKAEYAELLHRRHPRDETDHSC